MVEYKKINDEEDIEVEKFCNWKNRPGFKVGDNISKDGSIGVITFIIFPSFCYQVRFNDGQESHIYHHEVRNGIV